MYLFKERAVNRGLQSRFYAAFPISKPSMSLDIRRSCLGFRCWRLGSSWGDVGELCLGWLLELGSEGNLVADRVADLRGLYSCPYDARVGRAQGRHLCDLQFLMVIFCFWGGISCSPVSMRMRRP